MTSFIEGDRVQGPIPVPADLALQLPVHVQSEVVLVLGAYLPVELQGSRPRERGLHPGELIVVHAPAPCTLIPLVADAVRVEPVKVPARIIAEIHILESLEHGERSDFHLGPVVELTIDVRSPDVPLYVPVICTMSCEIDGIYVESWVRGYRIDEWNRDITDDEKKGNLVTPEFFIILNLEVDSVMASLKSCCHEGVVRTIVEASLN